MSRRCCPGFTPSPGNELRWSCRGIASRGRRSPCPPNAATQSSKSSPTTGIRSRRSRTRRQSMTQALEGIRIIDMTHNQAGPACAQILAFLGAEVIKLEEPKGGDVARRNMRDKPDSDSLFFLFFNANKRSLTLDLKSEEGKHLFREIIAKSDVLLENFGPGALDRLRLGYHALAKLNPRLIYATH